MDNCDCWISEPNARSFLNSPGPSSGYCSAEENLHSKYNPTGGGDSSSSSRFRGQRDLDSPWRGQSPSLALSSTTNPCLSGEGTSSMMKVDSLPELKSNSSFEDFMDTFFEPFSDTPRMSDYPGCETIADIEMIDTDCSMFFGRGGSSGVTQNFMSSDSSESNLMSLLKTQDRTGINGNQTSSRFGAVEACNELITTQQLGVGTAASKYVTVPVRSSLAMDQQRSHSVVNVSRSSGLCSTVSSLHQHMADMNDMSAAAGDASDYVLQFMPKPNAQYPVAKVVETIAKNPVSAASPIQNSAILGGVFSQRGSMSSLRSCEPKALGRMKGGAVATSCGTLLRHSVSIPNSMNTSAVQMSTMKEKSILDPKMRNGLITSTKTNNCDRTMTSGDMRGGRATSAYPALDDHRYTLKQVPPNHSVSKLRKSGGTHSSNPSFSGKDGTVRMTGGATSILEAFLRSTRPMDPNKGSNAALAAEGLSYLRLDEKHAKEKPDSPGLGGSGGCPSGMLLKKLLTGEIDQGQVSHRQRGEQHCEQLMVHDNLLCSTLPIDSPLTDGFGLDVDLSLDDSQIMGLMGTDMPDITESDLTESIWLGDLADQLGASELDEILREQTRQEDLWVEHYVNLV